MTTLKVENYELMAADLGPENPLPQFRHTEKRWVLHLDDTVPADVAAGMQYGDLWRVLPYRMQDGYNRVRQPRQFRSVVLENERLQATFIPSLGGRLWALLDKGTGRDLITRNAAFQPATLATRNAWFAGGIEWNTPVPGHSLLTCSPVHAARVDSGAGYPVLRLYAWDRVKCVPWAIDFHLPPESPFLFARVRLLNVQPREIPMYWWTNIAADEIPGGRVLYPADEALTHRVGGKFGAISLPETSPDVLVPTNNRNTIEYYGLLHPQRRPWVASVAPDGTGLVHASTRRLKGRKMFCWGMARGGRRWQNMLMPSGGQYIEIQAGLATTQSQQIPMPAGAEWTWVEAFGAFSAPAAAVHDANWSRAWQAAEQVLDGMLPQEHLEEMDQTLAACGRRAPEAVLASGEGWGALERRRCACNGKADPVPTEWVFPESDLGPEQAPWLALLERGALPDASPAENPLQGMVQSEWEKLLETSVAGGRSDHWLAWLHRGNMRMEALDPAGAAEAWQRSVARTPNGWAYRNLAVLEQRANRTEHSLEFMAKAWSAGPRIAKLAIEYAQLLSHFHRFEELREFCRNAPADIRDHERIRIFAAQAALETGAYDEVEKAFTYPFATIAEGETTLTDMWFSLHERKIAAAEGIVIDDALRARVRKEFPPPANIDFRLVSEISAMG